MFGAVGAGVVAFLFSFGNVKALAAQLGVESWIQPLIAPGIDVSVVVLVIVLQWLTLANAPKELIREANWWLIGAGVAMLAANVAPSIVMALTTPYSGPMLPPPEEGQLALTQLTEGQLYGRAILEALAPLGLIGWSHFGPKLVRAFAVVRARAELSQRVIAEERTLATEQDRAQAAADRQAAEAQRLAAEQAAAAQLAAAEQAAAELAAEARSVAELELAAAQLRATEITRQAEDLLESQEQAARRAERALQTAEQEIMDKTDSRTRQAQIALQRELDQARIAGERAERATAEAERRRAEAQAEIERVRQEASQQMEEARRLRQKAAEDRAAAEELMNPGAEVQTARPALRTIGGTESRPRRSTDKERETRERLDKIKEQWPETWWLTSTQGGPKQREIQSVLGVGGSTASILMNLLKQEPMDADQERAASA